MKTTFIHGFLLPAATAFFLSCGSDETSPIFPEDLTASQLIHSRIEQDGIPSIAACIGR